MNTNLQEFEDKLVDYSHYAYYEWAGCEKIENVSEEDIKSRKSVDTVVYDKRCVKGCFGIKPSPHWARGNVELAKVNLRETEKFGINSNAVPIKRKIDTLQLLKRFELISQVFTPNQYKSEEDIYFHEKVWESPENIDKAFKTEIKHLKDNPSLAMYWLLHFGLAYDKRFYEVKAKVQEFDLISQLPDIKLCIDYFEQIDTYHNMKVLNEKPKKNYYENLFLIRRANFLWNIFYEYEEMNEDFLKMVYFSASLHKGADLRVLWRVYLLKEYVQKFDKWEWLKEKLKADKDFYMASYLLAIAPNTKDKTNLANDVLNELYQNRKIFKEHDWFYKESTNPEFFNVAIKMLLDLKDDFDDDVLFPKVVDSYIENVYCDVYKKLQNAFYKRKGVDTKKTEKIIKELNKNMDDEKVAGLSKMLDDKIKNFNENDIYSLVNLMNSIYTKGKRKLAISLIKHIFKIEIKDKEKLLLNLIDKNSEDYDKDKEIMSLLDGLIKDEHDKNIDTIFCLLNNARGDLSKLLGYALKDVISCPNVFKKAIELLQSIKIDVNVYNYKLNIKEIFVSILFTRNNYFTKDAAHKSDYFASTLSDEQKSELLDICFKMQQNLVGKTKYSFLLEKIINDTEKKEWLHKNEYEEFIKNVDKYNLNQKQKIKKPLDDLMLNIPQKTPSKSKPKSWNNGNYNKAFKEAKKETFSGGIITKDKIYLVQNGVYDKDLNIFEKDLNKIENQFKFAKFPNLISNNARAIATCKDVPLFMAIKEGKIIYKTASSDEFVLVENVFDAKYGVSYATFIDNKAYFSAYGGYIYAQKKAGDFDHFECINDEIRLAYFTQKKHGEAFTTVAGFSEDEIYAGGEKGILWLRENGSWRILETPLYENNNHHGEDIEHMVCADDGYVYIAAGGKILKGRKDRWDIIYYFEESFIEQLVISDGKVVFLQKDYFQRYSLLVIENEKLTELRPHDDNVSIPKSYLQPKLYSHDKTLMLVGDNGAIIVENGKWKLPFHKNFDEEKMKEMGLYYE